jgi:hypothetical protein
LSRGKCHTGARISCLKLQILNCKIECEQAALRNNLAGKMKFSPGDRRRVGTIQARKERNRKLRKLDKDNSTG